jgi:hypothetical protein
MDTRASSDPVARAAEIARSLEPVICELRQQHPIQADIMSGVFHRVLEATSALGLNLAPQEFREKVERLLTEANELGAWLVDPEKQPSASEIEADIDSWVNSYVSSGFKAVGQYAELLRKAWARRPRGRPSTRRVAAVRALEAKLADPTLNWDDLADNFYPSAKEENIDSPAQALRQQVIALRRVLKKYGIPGWEPFERHRASKSKSRSPSSTLSVSQE